MTPNIIDSILKKQFRLHRGEGIQFGFLPLGFPDCSGSQGLATVWEPAAPVAIISLSVGTCCSSGQYQQQCGNLLLQWPILATVWEPAAPVANISHSVGTCCSSGQYQPQCGNLLLQWPILAIVWKHAASVANISHSVGTCCFSG